MQTKLNKTEAVKITVSVKYKHVKSWPYNVPRLLTCTNTEPEIIFIYKIFFLDKLKLNLISIQYSLIKYGQNLLLFIYHKNSTCYFYNFTSITTACLAGKYQTLLITYIRLLVYKV